MRPARDELLAVFAGGFVGSVARAELGAVLDPTPGHWPWATFVVNLVGAFSLGYFARRVAIGRTLQARDRAFLEVGICGALTTFSTLQLELLNMLDADRIGLAAGYAAMSITLGYAAVAVAGRLAGSHEASP